MSEEIEPVKEKKPPGKIGPKGFEFENWDQFWRFCTACAASREFKDVQTPEQAMVRIQAGAELGLTPIWSLCNVMVVNGRPTVWGDAMLGLVLRHKECDDIVETMEEDGTAVCTVYRRGRDPKVGRFSMEDAKRAGLLDKPIWRQYPARMRQMRARAFACRDAFGDVLRGLDAAEEVLDYIDRPNESREVDKKEIQPLILPDEVPAKSVTEDADPEKVKELLDEIKRPPRKKKVSTAEEATDKPPSQPITTPPQPPDSTRKTALPERDDDELPF
jgi:hypothetical protein